MCGLKSTNPSPIFQEDKFRLNKLCLKSFVEAFKTVKPTMHFIADFCGKEYEEMIKEIVPFEMKMEFTDLGINGTCLRQYELAKESTDETILFQECDYIYRPDTGKQMEEAIKHFGLISPYDHPDFYLRWDIHEHKSRIELFSNLHYRTAARNTMTFGMSREGFVQNYEILKAHGYLDGPVWKDMRDNFYPLWTPIPSFATHMAKDYLAPSVDWESIWETLI